MTLKSKRRRTNGFCKHPYGNLPGMWAIRILLDLEGWRGLADCMSTLTSNGRILQTFGLGYLEDKEIDKVEFLQILRDRQVVLEAEGQEICGVFQDNLIKLKGLAGLSDAEMKILAFSAVVHVHGGLEDTTDALGNMTTGTIIDALSRILDLSLDEVRLALTGSGILARSGILRLAKTGARLMYTKLVLMNGLVDVLFEPQADAQEMLRGYFYEAGVAGLTRSDYAYIKSDYQLIRNYLSAAQKLGLRGVNVLIHGRPCTGKSELARVVAQDLGNNLFEISMSDEDGDALGGSRRFSAYQLSQQILARQDNALVLFDEIEDVFPETVSPLFGRIKSEGGRKAWINRMLEDAPVPAIWISNAIDQIDNAFIRRFDFVLKLDHPPRKVRVGILNKHLKDLPVSDRWIQKVAENADMAPALVSRAARVVGAINDGQEKTVEANLERVLGHTLGAMGYTGKLTQQRETSVAYRLDVLNPDRDIERLVDGLKCQPHGRILLYGPPGTGKTEFGRYVAKELEKPLLVKRASELLGPYVGMTEKCIAGLFEQANHDDAVLLLDEADSFLQDRSGARASWEVSQVNELLTRMEAFEGLFICSTNLLERLDTATLRRFDFKIKLDYLKQEQAWILFRHVLESQGVSMRADNPLRKRLARYDNITPGDFSNVVRQHRFSGEGITADQLLKGLADESVFKRQGESRGIGFAAHI